MAEEISVEVVFALSEHQKLVRVSLRPGAQVADAIAASGLLEEFNASNLEQMPVGIWGRVVDPGSVVREGDRVEIYRPLSRDPREARRELARLQRLGSSS